MKIHFSKKEYRQLLDVVFLGDWVASAPRDGDDSPYAALREKIYSHAKAFGFDDLIVYNKHDNKHYEMATFEEQGVMALLDAYDAHVRHRED